jgi:ABC-2 type transport system permease protein
MLTMDSETDVASPPMTVPRATPPRGVQYTRAFVGLFLRDLHVLRREKFPFLIRVIMNPLLFLFVFTYIMPHMSGGAALNPTAAMAGTNFSTVLLPGLMAVAIMFSGIAAVALPLAQEFGITREIDDRVMCPLPVAWVAIEKIVFSSLQSMIAAALVFPLAYYVPSTPVSAHVNNWPFLILVLALASLSAGALGLVIGTSVKPAQIGLIFGTVVMPITFLGCVYYPWAKLDKMPILQHAVLINPIVYMSEGLRAALTPALPHMDSGRIVAMLWFFLVLLTWLGVKGFVRRVIG